jgi:hypothetical protein
MTAAASPSASNQFSPIQHQQSLPADYQTNEYNNQYSNDQQMFDQSFLMDQSDTNQQCHNMDLSGNHYASHNQ